MPVGMMKTEYIPKV